MMTKIALTLLFVSLVVGQLFRVPLPGQGGGLLLSDVAVVLVLLTAVFRGRSVVNTYGFLFFILWALFTLVIRIPELGWSAGLVAVAYWLRLTTHLLLVPALLVLMARDDIKVFAGRGWVITILSLSVLGLGQLVFLPDLNLPGWDPHQGRLVATWLDPNLIGAFLMLGMFWLLPEKYLLAFLVGVALLVTRSRTTLLALGGAMGVVSPWLVVWYLRRPTADHLARLLAVVGLGTTALVLAGLLLGERATGIFTFDPTVQLRLESWRAAWQVIQEHPWLGVGYNAYQFAAPGDFTIHSRAGADNSWLTLWATTGLIGVCLFAWPWMVIASRLAKQWWKHTQAQAGWALVALLALFLHSQFVNSFLYGHLMISLAFICALALSTTER